MGIGVLEYISVHITPTASSVWGVHHILLTFGRVSRTQTQMQKYKELSTYQNIICNMLCIKLMRIEIISLPCPKPICKSPFSDGYYHPVIFVCSPIVYSLCFLYHCPNRGFGEGCVNVRYCTISLFVAMPSALCRRKRYVPVQVGSHQSRCCFRQLFVRERLPRAY